MMTMKLFNSKTPVDYRGNFLSCGVIRVEQLIGFNDDKPGFHGASLRLNFPLDRLKPPVLD